MKTTVLYLLSITLLIQFSCSNTQEITMLRDISADRSIYELSPKEPPEHRISPTDILYLNIMTLEPEINEIFNPSRTGNNNQTGTDRMYGSPAGQYLNGYIVADDGTVSIPIIGKIEMAGLTLSEAEERLRARAEEYLKQPSVQVKFLNYKITIAGEVREPNLLYNYERNVNIFDAISMANGITEYADLTNVLVVRKTNGTSHTYRVDATSRNIYSSEVFYLLPNDFIYIPPTNLKRTRDNTNVYSLVLSAISTLIVVGTALNNNFF
ncbi:MAG: polysaccharide biosynthesis/export family protein [Bacteroidota bacterium]